MSRKTALICENLTLLQKTICRYVFLTLFDGDNRDVHQNGRNMGNSANIVRYEGRRCPKKISVIHNNNNV